MRFANKPGRGLTLFENFVFVLVFGFIIYNLLLTYGRYVYASVNGKGLWATVTDTIATHQYYILFVSLIILLNSSFLLWEVGSFLIQLIGEERAKAGPRRASVNNVFKQFALHYKSPFLAMLINELLPKLILIHMFWIWLPHFAVLRFFTINLAWYSWIYGYLCWEFSQWLFHFTSHRVRLFWCFHSPHHAPSEINITVTWIHFFAESYYSTFIRLLIMLPLGVNPAMFAVVIAIDSAWGIFIHVSDRALPGGRLGFLQHLIITPAHHRVHHAKNALYLDTNFASVLPVWDWILGTLQPLKKEVKADYGLIRQLDVTNFADLYFGELYLLYRDVKNANGLKDRLRFLFMPPGWTPLTANNTAPVLRRDFIRQNPQLAKTSRQILLELVKSRHDSVNDLTEEAIRKPLTI